MAGHTTLARMQKIDPAVIEALRVGTPLPDKGLEALHHFTTLVVRNRGWVDDADVDAFLLAGFIRRKVLEVVLSIATKMMSNYTNHIALTPLDRFMRAMNSPSQSPRPRDCSNRPASRRMLSMVRP